MTDVDKIPADKRKKGVDKLLSAITNLQTTGVAEMKESGKNVSDVESELSKMRNILDVDPPPHSKKIIIAGQALENIRYYLCYLFSLSITN